MTPLTPLDTQIRLYLEQTRGLLMMHDVHEAAGGRAANPAMNQLLMATLRLADSLKRTIEADATWNRQT